MDTTQRISLGIKPKSLTSRKDLDTIEKKHSKEGLLSAISKNINFYIISKYTKIHFSLNIQITVNKSSAQRINFQTIYSKFIPLLICIYMNMQKSISIFYIALN